MKRADEHADTPKRQAAIHQPLARLGDELIDPCRRPRPSISQSMTL
jgi:hypothetical protein